MQTVYTILYFNFFSNLVDQVFMTCNVNFQFRNLHYIWRLARYCDVTINTFEAFLGTFPYIILVLIVSSTYISLPWRPPYIRYRYKLWKTWYFCGIFLVMNLWQMTWRTPRKSRLTLKTIRAIEWLHSVWPSP